MKLLIVLIKKFIFDPNKKEKLIFDGYPRSLRSSKKFRYIY